MVTATVRFASNPKPAPVIAFGTGTALFKKDTAAAVKQAIASGFRFIDSADMYKNEEYTGEGMAASGLGDELFVLSKIEPFEGVDIGKEAREQAKRLKVDAFDVFLLHFPPRGLKNRPTNVEAWNELVKLKDDGVAKTIGVSNWLAHDIQEVLDSKPKHPIEMNEIELSPLLWNSEKTQGTLDICRKNKIQIGTYSQLTPLNRKDSIKAEHIVPVIEEIAKAHPGWTDSTVLMKYAHQRGDNAIVVTTTNSADRAKGYVAAFEAGKGAEDKLSEHELKRLDEAGAKAGTIKVWMNEWF